MMSPQLEDIVRKVRSDERIAPAEALVLWHEAPLWLLGELAARRKERVSGDKVYFNRNFHIEPTNLCVFNCNFCSYRRPKGSPEAWDYSLEEVERIARDHAGQGVTEVHIVGGVHPEHDLYYYVEMIRRVKAILPEATVKAFTAIELSYMIRKAGLTIDEGLRLLRSAGMEAIPGGGAEIFDEELRARICPDKGSTVEWFEVHAAAHRLGIPTNATILYGHVEELRHRIDHLLALFAPRIGKIQRRVGADRCAALVPQLNRQSRGFFQRLCRLGTFLCLEALAAVHVTGQSHNYHFGAELLCFLCQPFYQPFAVIFCYNAFGKSEALIFVAQCDSGPCRSHIDRHYYHLSSPARLISQ